MPVFFQPYSNKVSRDSPELYNECNINTICLISTPIGNIDDISKEVRDKMTFIPVKNMDEVLKIALVD